MYTLTKEKYLNDEEQKRLVEIFHKYKKSRPRDISLFALTLYTGGRAKEILNLRVRDLDMTHKSIFLTGLKNSRDRDIPLPDWVFELAEKQAAGKEPDEKLFNISYVRMYQLWLKYRPCKKNIHALRHTMGINLYRRKKDIKLLQAVLGHKSWKNSMIYADYHYNFYEVREAMLDFK